MSKLQVMGCISALLLVLCLQQASCLSCYQCNSHNDTRCADSKPPDEFKKECRAERGSENIAYTMCRKITQNIEFEVNGLPPDNRVIRSCGYDESNYKGKCYHRSGFGGRQEVCSCLENNCNEAPKLTAAILAVATPSLLLLAVKHFF